MWPGSALPPVACAGAFLADVLDAGDRLAVAERVEGRQRVVVHVVAAVVLDFGHGVHADVPVLARSAPSRPRCAQLMPAIVLHIV